jgi:hypothetical protein
VGHHRSDTGHRRRNSELPRRFTLRLRLTPEEAPAQSSSCQSGHSRSVTGSHLPRSGARSHYQTSTVQVSFLSPGFAFGHLLLMHSSSKSFQIVSLLAKLFILDSTYKLVLKETELFSFKLMLHMFKRLEVKETD